MSALAVIGVIIVLLIIIAISIYNSLVGLRNQVDNSWSQIDVQLKRRHDLIPNLVETAKGYMQHERGTFEAITNARSRAMSARTVSEAAKAEGALGQALSQFLLVVENYPELKANQNFLAVQEELSSTENKISFARQNYNDQVLYFNNKTQMFPSNIVAGMMHFEASEFFEVKAPEEREPVKVSFP